MDEKLGFDKELGYKLLRIFDEEEKRFVLSLIDKYNDALSDCEIKKAILRILSLMTNPKVISE